MQGDSCDAVRESAGTFPVLPPMDQGLMLSGLVTRTNAYEYCNNDISDTECIKMSYISFLKNNKNNETSEKSY